MKNEDRFFDLLFDSFLEGQKKLAAKSRRTAGRTGAATTRQATSKQVTSNK